jgi:K+ potassium transporter
MKAVASAVTATTSEPRPPQRLAALTALGIVYGDLGTSPLYTLQAVVGAAGGHFTAESALGVLSLIVWTLVITISIKYCLFVLCADPLAIALPGISGFPAVSSFWAMVMPPTFLVPREKLWVIQSVR